MSTFPVATTLSGAANQGVLKQGLEDTLAAAKQSLGAGVAKQSLTISAGSVTPAGGASGTIFVDTEGGAGTDDLTNVIQTNFPDNSIIMLGLTNNAHVVTVKHAAGGAGQISLSTSADFVLTTTTYFLLLKREGTLWNEIGRFPLPLTTKGDLLGRTTTNFARVPVGANGKVLVADSSDANGVGWMMRAQPGWAVYGNNSRNTSATPLTKFDLTASAVGLWEPSSGNTYFKTSPSTVTIDTATAGPAAGGRDQSGAFSANSWLYLYWTYNPGTDTLSGTVSVTGPMTGPALPSGYTAWAYAGAVRFNASSNFPLVRMHGNWRYYEVEQSALSGGTATTETAVAVSSLVPPSASAFCLGGAMTVQSTAGAVRLRATTGNDARSVYAFGASGETNQSGWGNVVLPNISQRFYYLWTAAVTARSFDAWIYGYEEALSRG